MNQGVGYAHQLWDMIFTYQFPPNESIDSIQSQSKFQNLFKEIDKPIIKFL